MKVSKPLFDLSEKILDTFDPVRLKKIELDKAKTSTTVPKDKWDGMVKELDKEEAIEKIEEKNFDQQSKDMIHQMMGCNRDHGVELDIYNKPYKEKMERIRMMKEQGNKAFQEHSKDPAKSLAAYKASLERRKKPEEEAAGGDQQDPEEGNYLEKASYYYAQALLIFYYLIPENNEEEVESNKLKLSCHLNQSLVFLKLERYDDCLNELDQILSGNRGLDANNVKALYRKVQVLELKFRFEDAVEIIDKYFEVPNKEEKDIKLFQTLKNSLLKKISLGEVQSQRLAQKMVNQTKDQAQEPAKEEPAKKEPIKKVPEPSPSSSVEEKKEAAPAPQPPKAKPEAVKAAAASAPAEEKKAEPKPATSVKESLKPEPALLSKTNLSKAEPKSAPQAPPAKKEAPEAKPALSQKVASAPSQPSETERLQKQVIALLEEKVAKQQSQIDEQASTIKQLSTKMADLEMGMEFIKMYGFQANQFEILSKAYKEKGKLLSPQEVHDQLNREKKAAEKKSTGVQAGIASTGNSELDDFMSQMNYNS